ncbi:agamous-like mads-box protein agl62 [Quercus suber]|uniref:Agamous-like mads-box protein agl62 n=1 Tax=Quercus suber TaxID=58331 RepID=A0AAW0JVF8_QUESU
MNFFCDHEEPKHAVIVKFETLPFPATSLSSSFAANSRTRATTSCSAANSPAPLLVVVTASIKEGPLSAQASPKKALRFCKASTLVFKFINLFTTLASQSTASKSFFHQVNSALSLTNSLLFPDFSKLPILPLHTLFTASKYFPLIPSKAKYFTIHSTAAAKYATFNDSPISTPSFRSISLISSNAWSVVSVTVALDTSDWIVRRRTAFLNRVSSAAAEESGRTWRRFLMTWSCTAELRIRNSKIHRKMALLPWKSKLATGHGRRRVGTGAMESKKTKGKQKIEMKKIDKEVDRLVWNGINKKASELVTLCGVEVGVVVFSVAGKSFSFGHPSVESVANRFLKQNPPRA